VRTGAERCGKPPTSPTGAIPGEFRPAFEIGNGHNRCVPLARPVAVGLRVFLAASVVLAGCTKGDAGLPPGRSPVEHPQVGRTSGWTRIPIAGVVRDISGNSGGSNPAVAVGEDSGGSPLLMTLTGSTARRVDYRWPGTSSQDGLASIADDRENAFFTTRSRPGTTQLPEVWSAYSSDFAHPVFEHARHDALPRDEAGTSAVWVDPLADGEEDYWLVGVVPTAASVGAVHVWNADPARHPVDSRTVYVFGDPRSPGLCVGSTETTVVVAGMLSPTRGSAPSAPSLWLESWDNPNRHGPWQRIPISPAPDVVTDIAYWELGFWVAAARDNRPVVYNFDRGNRLLEVPRTRLDPARPTVLIGRAQPNSRPQLLATQSVDGPTAWLRTATGYRPVPAPSGQLQAATMAGDNVYLVIDGVVWTRRFATG
jgi:hypothetical protein